MSVDPVTDRVAEVAPAPVPISPGRDAADRPLPATGGGAVAVTAGLVLLAAGDRKRS